MPKLPEKHNSMWIEGVYGRGSVHERRKGKSLRKKKKMIVSDPVILSHGSTHV